MGRTPKPWYWERRKEWYVTVEGTRHRLGDEEDSAFAKFYDLMAASRRKQVTREHLVYILDKFLDWTHKNRPKSYTWYRDCLQSFSTKYPNLYTDELSLRIHT